MACCFRRTQSVHHGKKDRAADLDGRAAAGTGDWLVTLYPYAGS